jgi:hypothetical protein
MTLGMLTHGSAAEAHRWITEAFALTAASSCSLEGFTPCVMSDRESPSHWLFCQCFRSPRERNALNREAARTRSKSKITRSDRTSSNRNCELPDSTSPNNDQISLRSRAQVIKAGSGSWWRDSRQGRSLSRGHDDACSAPGNCDVADGRCHQRDDWPGGATVLEPRCRRSELLARVAQGEVGRTGVVPPFVSVHAQALRQRTMPRLQRQWTRKGVIWLSVSTTARIERAAAFAWSKGSAATLTSAMAGRPVETPVTTPYGCAVHYAP